MQLSSMRYVAALEFEALDEVMGAWRREAPRSTVVALVPEAERAGIPALQRASRAHDLPLAGAVFPALVVDTEFRDRGVWLLRTEQVRYATLVSELPREVAPLQNRLEALTSELTPHLGAPWSDLTLAMIFDAMVPNIGTVLDELYLRLANRVRYMGVNAGSETFQPMPCLFDGERIAQGGVLMLLLEGHRGAILEHGYGVPDEMITATSTVGNRILQIDWRPAFEVYQELARERYGVAVDRDTFYQTGVHFPFGIVRANGVVVVRIPVALEDDGSLYCVGEVPANAVLTLLRAPEVDSVHTLETLVRGLGELHGKLAGRDMLLFYCAGRRLHLGLEAAAAELRGLGERTEARQVAGALSLGEIGSSTEWAYPLFHNATLVASVWGE